MLLLGVLEDTLGAEVLAAHHTVELYLLLRMLLAVHDLGLGWHSLRGSRGILGRHGQPRQNLVVHRQVVRADLMVALVVRALDHAVLRELAGTLATEGVTAG